MAVKVKNSLENTALELFGLDASRVQNISTSPGIGQMLVEVTLVPAFPECPDAVVITSSFSTTLPV